ncbi:MAG TPA: methionyl-tRNA formyltransferase, partial [Burkholderiaceae bacterium]|nr:methionyl-tRNA formyltransferase [Burkholderiaceae bacterium]
MRLAFAGTPAFAATALQAIVAAGHDVTQVLTQPDRPAGRGLKLQASAVKNLASQQALALLQPAGLRLDGRFATDAQVAHDALRAAAPDVIVVAAYGLLLPPWLLELPRLGCLNIHASVLPRWRGAAPIQRAIEAGDSATGISIMQMDAGLDTGGVLLARSLPIHAADTSA